MQASLTIPLEANLVSGDNPVYMGNVSIGESRTVNWTLVFVAGGIFNLDVNVTGYNAFNMSEFVELHGYAPVTVDTTPPSITDVSQLPLGNNVLPEDEVRVNATVTDYLSEVKAVTLNFTNGDGAWITVDMTNVEADVWNATIRAFPCGTNVTYIIIAEDIVNNTTTEDLWYRSDYSVIPEFPSIMLMPLFMMATLIAVMIRRREHFK